MMSLDDSLHSSSDSSYHYQSDSSDLFDDDGLHQSDMPPPLYNQEPLPCPICLEAKVEEGLALILPTCHHSFCTTCFLTYLETRIGEGGADAVSCPHIFEETGVQCNSLVGDEVLKEIMDAAAFRRFMGRKDIAFVRKSVDYHHCPTPDCTNIVLCKSFVGLSDLAEQSNVEVPRICDCFKCGRTSCLSCGASPFHMNKTCEEHDVLCRVLKDHQMESRSRFQEHIRSRGLQSVHQVMDDRRLLPFGMETFMKSFRGAGHLGGVDRSRANEETRYDFSPCRNVTDNNNHYEVHLENMKRCRRCGHGIELNGGCLKMKCICGYRFCYNCGSENAQCGCTNCFHGFFDQVTGRVDFKGLRSTKSYT